MGNAYICISTLHSYRKVKQKKNPGMPCNRAHAPNRNPPVCIDVAFWIGPSTAKCWCCRGWGKYWGVPQTSTKRKQDRKITRKMEDKEEKEVRVQRLVTPCSFSMDSNDARHYDAAPLICRVPMTSFGRATVFHIAQSTVQGCAQIFFFFSFHRTVTIRKPRKNERTRGTTKHLITCLRTMNTCHQLLRWPSAGRRACLLFYVPWYEVSTLCSDSVGVA